jgi:hypothetical protein
MKEILHIPYIPRSSKWVINPSHLPPLHVLKPLSHEQTQLTSSKKLEGCHNEKEMKTH